MDKVIHDLTLAHREKNGGISLYLISTPFPLTGKGRDRGAQEPIKPITPTFVLPHRGEGIRALQPVSFFMSWLLAAPKTQFSKKARRTRSLEF